MAQAMPDLCSHKLRKKLCERCDNCFHGTDTGLSSFRNHILFPQSGFCFTDRVIIIRGMRKCATKGGRRERGMDVQNEFVCVVRAYAGAASAAIATEEILIEPVQLLGKRASQYCSL